MKKVGKPVFFIILVLVAAFVLLSVFGIHTMYGDIKTARIKGMEDIRWGMDFGGGVEATYAPPADYFNPKPEEFQRVTEALEARLLYNGFRDFNVFADTENAQISVRFAWEDDRGDLELQQVANLLSQMQFLTMREGMEVDQSTGEATGVTASSILLDSTHVKKAKASTSTSGHPAVDLTLNEEGTELLTEISTRLLGQEASFWIDETLIAQTQFDEVLSRGVVTLMGAPNQQVAKLTEEMINAGPLPFTLSLESLHTLSPTYSPALKNTLLWIGLGGLLLAAVFFILRYRLSGIVATVCLFGQLGAIFVATSGFLGDVNGPAVTRASAAGMLTALLFGVFSNLLVSETIKRELATGKSLDGAVETAVSKSFSILLDFSVLLAVLGIIIVVAFKETIFGFGHALLAGVAGNFVMTGILNRFMLRSLLQQRSMRTPWHYGGKKQ